MTRIRLRVYRDPGGIEAFLRLSRKEGGFEHLAAAVDTGAEVSLLPESLLGLVDYRFTQPGSFKVQQAGVSRHTFEAREALIMLALADEFGGGTSEFEVPVWVAETERAIVGFAGILDRAILHLDMPNLTGYLDINI